MKKLQIRIAFALLLLWVLPQGALAARMLIPVGQVIGLELRNDTVTVAAFEEPQSVAKAAGVRIGDLLLAVDGHTIACAEDVRTALNRSDGTVKLRLRRDGKEHTLTLRPSISPDGPRLGVYLRQGITGIGTVTWYEPETGKFATLGHGINDSAGQLMPMTGGAAFEASVVSVRKGRCGAPGQLMGALSGSAPVGTLDANTACGVFGSAHSAWSGEALPVADSSEVHTGPAVIRSTVQGNRVQEYSVEIQKIYSMSRENGRNMLIKITDPALLDATGGIVQGMSGSPVIQNGKLVGAVTHVLVNDPQTGYGIFIENMLEAAG